MNDRDYDYREAKPCQHEDISAPRTPLSATSSESGGDRHFRIGNIILQAAQQAQQEEQAQATARTAAQIAAQARKMRSRTRKVQPVAADEDYDVESSGMSHRVPSNAGWGMGSGDMDSDMGSHDVEYGDGEKGSPTAKDIRGQKSFHPDGKAYNLPLPPAFALLDIEKPGKRSLFNNSLFKGPLGYRVCLWTAITLMALSTIIGLSMITAFVALQPKAPTYDLQEIRVQWWVTYRDTNGYLPSTTLTNGSALSTVYLYADVVLVTNAQNHNNQIGIHYQNTTFEISYQGTRIGFVTVPPVYQPPNNVTSVLAEWKCDGCVVLNVGHYLEADQLMGSVPLNIKMTVDASVEIAGVVSPGYVYTNTYDVKIKPPPSTSGS